MAGLTQALKDVSPASLNNLDYARLQPGTMAIAGNGVHILAYLGDRQWIQADPGANKVIIGRAPSTNLWFQGPVKLVSWRVLASAP